MARITSTEEAGVLPSGQRVEIELAYETLAEDDSGRKGTLEVLVRIGELTYKMDATDMLHHYLRRF